jgi:methylated-DNA-[protein]-cysteine S-methyltransferase
MIFYESKSQSPLGILSIIGDSQSLLGLFFRLPDLEDWLAKQPRFRNAGVSWNSKNALNQSAIEQLNQYFSGNRKAFTIPLQLYGTPFQTNVWKTLQKIPYGITWSYQRLAREVGNSLAMRAAGSANGRNPIPIIIPCHRVIRKNGNIGGYSSGIPIKRWLLKHEGIKV